MNKFSTLICVVLLLSVVPAWGRRGAPSKPIEITTEDLEKGTTGHWDDGPVEKAIEKGIAYLRSMQKSDGSFGNNVDAHSKAVPPAQVANPRVRGTLNLPMEPLKYSVGCASSAVYALLKAGVDVKDEAVQKGLKYITSYDTDLVYAIGMRCNAFVAASKYQSVKYSAILRHDAIRLIRSVHRQTGGWHYSIHDNDYHNSSAQYGILGIWGYQMLKGEIPRSFWPLAWKYWSRGQGKDGGWGYYPPFHPNYGDPTRLNSIGTMSTAGLASLFVINDAMNSSKYAGCSGGKYPPEIVRGLEWFDKQFTNTMTGKTNACRTHFGHDFFCYYLYGVERVGHASGYKYFGNQDWFKLGTLALLKKQGNNGAWFNVPETAFAIVFLCKGRHPVLFNKLEYPGDWNNRPRNLANLTAWMSSNYENEFNWQIVNLKVDPFEWHDSPLLCISGSRKPAFSDKEVDKLKHYIQQGGTVFSCTECNGAGFKAGIREIYRKAFPDYEMVKLSPDHPLYTIHGKLKGQPEAYMISNGSRPLVIHTDHDVVKEWQLRTSATRKNMFLFGVNLTRYIIGSYKDLVPRGQTYWPYPANGATTVKIARIKYGGNFNPEPLAVKALSMRMSKDKDIAIEEVIVSPTELATCGAKIALLTGTDSVSLSSAQLKTLKVFVEEGGTLVVDSTGGKEKFYASMHKHLGSVFGPNALCPISSDSPILTGIEKIRYRTATRKRKVASEALLQIVTIKGRPAVILSREDLTTGLLGCPSGVVDGYAPQTAYEIMRNIISNSR